MGKQLIFKLLFTSFFLPILNTPAIANEPTPFKILLVVAHPDDEYNFAGLTYQLAKERGAHVDQLVVTNGEGGYHYAGLAEKYYQISLSNEKDAKAHLPAIRKKELEAAGKVLGIQHHFYLDQPDTGFTTDIQVALKSWNEKSVLASIEKVLKKEHYDFVFVLEPFASTHGHHQAATYLALEAVQSLPEEQRPVVLGAFTRTHSDVTHDPDHAKEMADGNSFESLPHLPLTQVIETPLFTFDRNRHPLDNTSEKITYQTIINWMIAEHKSQGLFQTYPGRDDEECFRVFSLSGPKGTQKAEALFR